MPAVSQNPGLSTITAPETPRFAAAPDTQSFPCKGPIISLFGPN